MVRPGRLPARRCATTARWPASTGPRCTRARRRSARCTCSASTRPRRACGSGPALTVAGLRYLARPRAAPTCCSTWTTTTPAAVAALPAARLHRMGRRRAVPASRRPLSAFTCGRPASPAFGPRCEPVQAAFTGLVRVGTSRPYRHPRRRRQPAAASPPGLRRTDPESPRRDVREAPAARPRCRPRRGRARAQRLRLRQHRQQLRQRQRRQQRVRGVPRLRLGHAVLGRLERPEDRGHAVDPAVPEPVLGGLDQLPGPGLRRRPHRLLRRPDPGGRVGRARSPTRTAARPTPAAPAARRSTCRWC